MFPRLRLLEKEKHIVQCRASGNMVGGGRDRKRDRQRERNLNSNCIMKKFNYDQSEQAVKFTFIMLGTL